MKTSPEILESEFCPPLDPTLVYAIYHDFASDPDGLAKARELLTSIKESALLEQETDFDPSASSGLGYVTLDGQSSTREGAGVDVGASHSESTEFTASSDSQTAGHLIYRNRSTSSSEDGLLEFEGNEYLDSVELLDVPTKEVQLIEFFPTLDPALITYTLRKCNNNFSKATDELLNQVYFESTNGEEKVSTKGVDAFFVPQSSSRGKKGKNKRKNRGAAFSPVGDDTDTFAPFQANKWRVGSEAVDFIASRVKLPAAEVASIYHREGGSARSALLDILGTNIKKNEGRDDDDPAVVEGAVELISDFPLIDPVQAMALSRLTHPSTANAHELAKMLLTSPPNSPKGGLQVIPRYAPIDVSDASPFTSPKSPKISSRSATTLAAARHTAFTQASAAHRKGKSDPLMRAVAGFYGQIGRDYDAALKSASAAEADALVMSQSTPTQLDLHGVSVKDATRIARENVTAWWHELGEGRINRRGVGTGYRIVTGVGHHSEGGRGKIGPAVGRMLIREGWKVEFDTGVLVVTGVFRKK